MNFLKSIFGKKERWVEFDTLFHPAAGAFANLYGGKQDSL